MLVMHLLFGREFRVFSSLCEMMNCFLIASLGSRSEVLVTILVHGGYIKFILVLNYAYFFGCVMHLLF
jgi:hypothetical protein